MSVFPVKITNAHKYYNKGKNNELHVMDNITLELPESGMVAIFGQSGCGKTTLLNAVGGLDKIASGSIELFGQSIREKTDTLRNKYIGYIFQNYNLNVTETVYENVSAALRLCGMTDENEISERTMAALTNVDMEKYRDRTPDTLSGGQQQRVAIARAIVKNPAIILADEPTGNLDEANTVMVMDILKEISRTHLVLLVTHEANLVDYYCDRVIEIVDGRVNADRINEGANGYVQRNKNHIYLGELEKAETSTPGVQLEYYCEPAGEITLQVVNVGGKLYLKTNNPAVKILDEGSEIKLVEGVFHEAKTAEAGTVNGRKLDMSKLTPVEGKEYGRLYHWKNSMKYAWRENFSKKQKKGKNLLRACLFLLAVVMVFMTAAFGSGLRSYTELRRDHNENLFYVPLDPTMDYSAISAEMGNHGMDFARIIGGNVLYDAETLSFQSSAFMTAKSVTLTADAHMVDVAHAADLRVVAGEGTLAGGSDVLITTALADKLLETSTVSYLNDYTDLIGMISRNRYTYVDNSNLRIAGVVQSDELFFYVDSLSMAKHVLNSYFWMPVVPASDVGLEASLKKGQMAFLENSGSPANLMEGDKVQILGLTFAVSEVIHKYSDISEYPAYVLETYGETLITDPGIYADQVLADGTPYDAGLYTWLLDYYFKYIPEFYQTKLNALQPYEDVMFEEWAIAYKQNIAAYATVMGYDPYYVCGAYLYHAEKGSYPTDAELAGFMETDGVLAAVKNMTSYDAYYTEYDQFMNRHWNDYSKSEYYYVVSDGDYIAMACSAGKTDDLGFYTYEHWVYDDVGISEEYYSNHLMIRSSDPAATAAYLTGLLGEDGFMPPEGVFDEIFREMRSGVLVAVISVGVVLVLMCLCVFFIMRSSFMSRVREVGILRAIGVTKRNLIFRFAVETALLILLTLVLGYVLCAWFIGSLSGAALFSTIFYFPLWMALALLILICAASMVFGVLPALTLLRKTPSEILSKYDI
ncbi:MAG: ABC transporter ATP-binding protein/permease [Clostridia bacterium]|nr:ABC transporter ATP-binding protein/permease [Clostridia bacterium]